MATTVRLTADDLAALPDDECRYELIRGELIQMSPDNLDHGEYTENLLVVLLPFVRSRRLGRAVTNVGFTLEQGPDTVLAPDLAFIAADRIPPRAGRRAFVALVPDLVVEVLSPSNNAGEMTRKLAIYRAVGVRLMWFLDPHSRSVAVYTPTGAALLGDGDTLDGGDVLPGFAMPVADLFA